jgi:cytochrome c biogenesis protein
MVRYRPEGLEDTFSPEAEAPATGVVNTPSIGFVGWLRWMWRQLTSMRVALLLLMLLAVAAVPGTVFPQRAQDVTKVAQYLVDHPTTGPWLDRLGFFDVYASVWFSAIYILLFVSLVGCILPRTKVHLAALRGRPPRTPRRFSRFPAQGEGTSADGPEQVARAAAAVLRKPWLPLWPRYRVDVRDEGDGAWSVSAERGYLRETGNLLFHLALVGLLVSIATGQLLHYRGQAIVVQGDGFANSITEYDTFEQGGAFSPSSLVPFTMQLDDFESTFDPVSLNPRDFTAHVTLTEPGREPAKETIKVNQPLAAGGAKVYLQGNGYAPEVTVRDAAGNVAGGGRVPFLPQNVQYTSRGVIKVPDVTGEQDQIGLVGYLLPTAAQVSETTWQSVHPQPGNPLLVLTVWHGNLGLDTGVPQNVYELDEARMEQSVDASGKPVTLYVKLGETVDLPDGLGTFTFDALPRFVALDLRHDPALTFVLVFAVLAFVGLATSLFAPRRRIWVRATPGDGRTVVSAAGLARGDDVGLQPELDRIMRETLPGTPAGTPADHSHPPASPQETS